MEDIFKSTGLGMNVSKIGLLFRNAKTIQMRVSLFTTKSLMWSSTGSSKDCKISRYWFGYLIPIYKMLYSNRSFAAEYYG